MFDGLLTAFDKVSDAIGYTPPIYKANIHDHIHTVVYYILLLCVITILIAGTARLVHDLLVGVIL